MRGLILDSGGVTRLARRNSHALAVIRAFRREDLWPPVVPSMVLVECLTGRQRIDATVNRLLKACDIVEHVPAGMARRAASLRALARQGSAVDALVIAMAEPGGDVLSADLADLRALTAYAVGVTVHRA